MTSLVVSVCVVSCLLSLSFGAIIIESSKMTAEQFVCTERQAGDLRLVKELNDAEGGVIVQAKEGRLEVCLSYINDTEDEDAPPEVIYEWGTVCDDNFSKDTATAICKTFTVAEYGFDFSDGVYYGRSNNTKYKVGGSKQQHYLDEMDCPEGVTSWWDCGYSGKDDTEKVKVNGTRQIGRPITNCNHKEDVFIECKEVLFCYHCSGDSYDDCSALNMQSKQCGTTMNSCFRKVKQYKAGEMSVTHGCMADTNCTAWEKTCKADKDNEMCYCNACTATKCNSLFQRMISDFGEYSKDFGKLVEWMISNFTKIMRYVLFDISAYG